MKVMVKTFEVKPEAPEVAPAALPERSVQAATLDAARNEAARLFVAERRPVRALSFLADGGIVAYVLPPLPEPTPEQRPRRRRRPRGRS